MVLMYVATRFFGSRIRGGFVVYLIALIFGAWSGYGPGVVSLVALCLAPYFFVPKYSLAKVDPTILAALLLISLLVSRLSAMRRRVEEVLRRSNDELDARV